MFRMTPKVAAAIALVTAVATGFTVQAIGDDNTATATIIGTGAASYFVPMESYRTLDTRTREPGTPVGRTKDDPFLDLALPAYVRYENDTPNVMLPDEAVAVTYNITVTETVSAGFVQVDTFGYTTGETSTVNWDHSGQTIANSGVAMLGTDLGTEGVLGIYVDGLPDAAAHIVLDITGYYVPVE